MELLGMFPTVSDCKITVAGKKEKICFSEITLKDHLWCLQNYKLEIHEFLERYSGDLEEICRLLYRQFTEESKDIFKVRKATMRDEEGKKSEIEIGGYKLLHFYLENESDYASLMSAYQKCYLCSMPVVSKKSKKKAMNLKR